MCQARGGMFVGQRVLLAGIPRAFAYERSGQLELWRITALPALPAAAAAADAELD